MKAKGKTQVLSILLPKTSPMIIEGRGCPSAETEAQKAANNGHNRSKHIIRTEESPCKGESRTTGMIKCMGIRVNWASKLARRLIAEGEFARYRLPMTVQTKNRCSTISMGLAAGPTWSVHQHHGRSSRSGIPRANIGKYAPITALLLVLRRCHSFGRHGELLRVFRNNFSRL